MKERKKERLFKMEKRVGRFERVTSLQEDIDKQRERRQTVGDRDANVREKLTDLHRERERKKERWSNSGTEKKSETVGEV